VDIGVHQDGLVHVSHLASRFVRNPHDAVRVGDLVMVKVLSADAGRKRIALSIKEAGTGGEPKLAS
jgi:protein Tex